jgi:hypothetical protein
MPTLVCPISQALQEALETQSKQTGEPISHLVSSALSRLNFTHCFRSRPRELSHRASIRKQFRVSCC